MNAGRTDQTGSAGADDPGGKEHDPLLHPARAKDIKPGAAGGGQGDEAPASDQSKTATPASPQAKKLQDRIDDSIGAAGAGPAA